MPNPRRGGKTTNYKHEQRKEAAKKANSVLKETAKTVKQTAEKITTNSTSRAAQSQQSHSSNSRKTSTQNRQQNYQVGNSRLRYGTGASQNRSGGGSKSTLFQDRMEKYQGNPRKRMPQGARNKAEERSERLTNLTKGTARQIAGSHVKAISSLYAADEEKNTERTGVNGIGGNARRRGSRYVGQKGRNDRRTEEQKRNDELQLQKARETNVSVKNAKSRNAKKASDWASGQIDKGNEEIEKGKKGLGKAGSFAADVYSGGLGLGADALAGPLAIPAMFSRAYGQSYHTAEKEGANKKQASLYAAGAAGLEAASEKLFAVATPLRKLYGKGAGDEIADRFINKVVSKMSTQTGKDAAYHGTKTLMAAITEGLEEMVSEGLEPTIANQIYANALGNPHETSAKDIFYAGAVGGALGGILGGSGQVIEYGQGKKVQDIYGETGIRDLARKAQESDEDSGDDVKGAAINEMINNGQGVAAGQANELYNAVYKQSIKDMQREDLAIKSAESIMEREGLQSPVRVNKETGEMFIGRKTSENFEAAKAEASDVMEQLQLPDVNSEQIVSAVAAIQTGIAGIDEINMFTKGNPEARTVYETMTGIKLPETNKETRELLYETMAINRVNSARAETTDYLDRLKGSVQQDVTRNYEQAGQQAFTELFKAVDTENKDKFESFIIAFDDYYSAGRAGIDYAAIASIDNPAYKNTTVQARKAAYEAGQQDRFLAADTANGLQIKIGQTAKEIRSQTKTGASRGKLIFDLSRENKAAVTASEQKMFRMLAKSLNINIHIVDDLDGANGFYLDGEVYLAMNADRGLEYVFAHEVTHHMQKYAPEEYNMLKELVRTKWTQQGGINDALGEKIAQYAAHDVELTREDALDEIIADSTYEMLQDEEFIDEVCKTDRGIAQAVLNAIKSVLKKLRAVLAEGDGYTPKQNAALLSNLDILKEFERLWADGFTRAAKNRDAVLRSSNNYVIRLSAKEAKKDSIRSQMRANLEEINKMDPVVKIKSEGYNSMSDKQFIDHVMADFKKRGYGVYRKDFGFISLDETYINRSLNYLNTEAEYAAFATLPYVFKKGIAIRDKEHKGRNHNTVTFAAPVEINEKPGIVGAVVMQTKGNRYKTHRILMPDGSEFVFEKEKTEVTTSGMTEDKINDEGPDITSAVGYSIPEPGKNDKKQFSLKDSDGRELSQQQAEYFKDSKIRDEDGNLQIVYHGSSENFTTFDRTKTRANMDIQGNFFSPWELDAKGYGENVRAFYLNITNPAPEGVAYKALNKFKGQNEAGIKAREYLESLGYDGVNNENEEYIAFYPEQIKSVDNENPTNNTDIRFSFAGESALNADNKMLAKAKEMYNNFESSEEIRKATGWHLGADDKWRFEIDDSQMEVFPNGDALFRKMHPEYVRLQDLYDKFWEGELSEAEQNELSKLDEIWGNEYARLNKRLLDGNAHLIDIMRHDVLYKNYPELANVQIKVKKLNGANGSYAVGGNIITIDEELLNSEYRKRKRSETLIHEIQHAIQDIEGFAKGANYEMLEMAIAEAESELEISRNFYDAATDNLLELLDTAGYFDKYGYVVDITSTDEQERIKKENISDIEEVVDDFANYLERYMTSMGKLNDLKNMSPQDFYRYSAGEVEARDTANRLTYNEAGRKGVRPDIDSPSIITEDYIKYSLPDEDDINDYINSNPTEFVDVPPVKDYEREAQKIKNMSIGELQEQVKKLRNDKLFTKGKILDKESVREEMNNLVKTLVSYREGARNKTDWNILEMLMENASTIYTAIKDGDVSGASITAWEAALNVVENLRLVDDSMFNEYKDLRDTMRNTQVTISEDDKTSIPDFKDFRKKNMGRLAIVNEGGIPVDTLYGELCDKYPELFDPEITHPADQLIAMAEVRDSLEPYDVMLSDEETEQLVKETAQDILDISARGESWKSFADKKKEYYDNKVKTLKARHIEAKRDAIAKRDEMWEKRLEAEKQKAKDIKAKERERADKRVNAEKQKARDKADKQKQRKEHMKRFGSIYKNYKWLSDRLVTPTDDKHIPEGFRTAVADLLQQMDFQTKRSIKLEAKYGKSGNTLRMEDLRRRLAEISKEDGSGIFEYDGYVFELMDALAEKLEGKTIDQATNEELASIDTLLKSIVCNVRNYNKAFSDSIKETISALGDNAINTAADVISRRKKRRYDRTGALGGLDTLMNESMLTPRDFFEQIGGGMETVFMAMRKGFDRHVDNITKTRDFFDTVFAPYHKKTFLRKRAKPGSEIESWRDNSQTQTFNLDSGDTIKLNPAQIMSLYCLSKREQAQGHILGSGIIASRVDNASKLKQALGAKIETEGSAVMVTLADLSKIISALTPEQIEMADKLQGYLNNECAEWGNEVSMRLYGYRKFTEENYFPIKSADAYLDSNFESREQVERIKNFGFTKGTIINANNPIMVDDIFRVVADHINKMSLYNAFAAPISDFTRVYNYKQRDEGGLLTGSVKSSLEDAYGRKAINYINRFVADVNNTTKTRVEGMMRFVNKSLANYKKATIGFNMRVALQQPTAVMRAFVLMSPKYFVNGSLNVKKNLEDMKTHCQIARWKSWGYNQVDMARDIDDIMMNNEWSRIDTVTMEIYGALDNITWSTIWAAVRKETKAKYPDVKVDSDEFYRLCNERASEVFDKTQVVDSVFHRSQVMRNTETMSKMMTSFMAEPTRTFNMVRTELVKARDLWNQGEKGKAAGKANRALSVFVLNAAAVSAAAAIADSLRGKDADDDDEPDKWWENALANFWDNINILNMIPVAKDIWGFVDGWGSQNMALEGYEALVKSIMEIPAAENKSEAWLKVAESMGLVMGLPVKNVIRELKVLGIDVYAAEVGSESEDKEKSIIDKIPGLSNIKGFVSGLIKDGSSLDNVLNKFGRNLTDEEKEQSEYNKILSDIKGDIEGLSGVEREEAIWKKVTADYTTYIKNGEFSELRKMRKMLGDLGGDVEKFDESILSKTKTALKKNIGEDSVKVWEYRVFLKDQYDMTDGKINQEVIMKSDASKEFQKAACFDDYDGMVNTISALYDAGLSEGELDILYESRSKAIDVSELSTGEFTFPASGEITSSFGYRNAPTAGASSYHEAIDIGAAAGSDVAAADGGQVTYCGWYGGKGNMVRIKHGNGTYTEYSHLQGYTVQKGDAVAKGQTIGLVGSTGVSTGPHLDFRVKVNGTYVDPMIYFK